MTKKYTFSSKIWLYPGNTPWHFITLPVDIAEEINLAFSHLKKGFGSIRVKAMIGKTYWETSIFPDKKSGSYFLPVKAAVRKMENLTEGSKVTVEIEV